MFLLLLTAFIILGPAVSLCANSPSSDSSFSSTEPPDPHDLHSVCGHPLKEVIGKLGEGNAGITWLVDFVDIGPTVDPRVALKINSLPHGELNEEEEYGDTMANAHLNGNPYGVKVHAVCVQEGHTMVIMEYANGPTVGDVISHHEKYAHLLKEANIRETFCQILEGARYMHKNLCTHGDLVAGNVILTDNGAKIIDYERVERFDSIDDTDMKRKLKIDGGDLAALLVEMMTEYTPADKYSVEYSKKRTRTYNEGITEELRTALTEADLNMGASEQIWRADPAKLYHNVCIKKPRLFKESQIDDGDSPTQMGESNMRRSVDQQ